MLYGVLPLWLFSWFTTWNILSSRSILPIPRLAEYIGSRVFNVVFTLFAGKAYAIFALLFGFTFYIQSHNLKRRGGTSAVVSCGGWYCWQVSQP